MSTMRCDNCGTPVTVPDDWPVDWALCAECGPEPERPSGKFSMSVDPQDEAGDGLEWTAAIYDEDGDVLATGWGATPLEAAQLALEDIETYTDEPARAFRGLDQTGEEQTP